MNNEYDFCGECKNSFTEEPDFTSWDCKYSLCPKWNDEQECWECKRFKMVEYEEE